MTLLKVCDRNPHLARIWCRCENVENGSFATRWLYYDIIISHTKAFDIPKVFDVFSMEYRLIKFLYVIIKNSLVVFLGNCTFSLWNYVSDWSLKLIRIHSHILILFMKFNRQDYVWTSFKDGHNIKQIYL